MIDKIKTWIKKLKITKKSKSLEDDGEQDIHLDAQIPDEDDLDLDPHSDHETEAAFSNESDEEDLEFPEVPSQNQSDATGEIKVKTTSDDATSEFNLDELQKEDDSKEDTSDQISEEDEDGIPEFDLNQDLSLKDKLSIFFQNLKDKIQRIDFRKFKNFKFPVSPFEEGNSQSITDKLSKKFNVKIPKQVEVFERKVKKFPWQNLHNEVFSPKNRTAINKGFLFLVILIAPYYIGTTIGQLLKGTSDYKNLNNNVVINIDRSNELTNQHVNEIKNAKLFKTEKVNTDNTVKPIKTGPEVCKSATKKSDLPIKLVNTIVLQDSVKSIASVQIRSKELNDFHEGDKIENIAKLDKISRLGIIVKNLKSGTCESIDNTELAGYKKSPIAVLDKKTSKSFVANKKIEGIENEGNTFKIKKDFLKEKMKNISDILTQARGIQIPNPDGTMSFKIVDIEPGGVFSYLGIQNNDVITHIGGKKISDLNEVMSLFGKLSSLDQLSITVTRGGEEVPLDYKLQ